MLNLIGEAVEHRRLFKHLSFPEFELYSYGVFMFQCAQFKIGWKYQSPEVPGFGKNFCKKLFFIRFVKTNDNFTSNVKTFIGKKNGRICF